MEWNTKWDWENHEIFSSKVMNSPKKLQSTNWGNGEGEEDIDGSSFNLSGVVGGSGGSASDMGNNSSAKSSISASTESSFKEGIKVSKFSFDGFNTSSRKKEFAVGGELNGTSPLLEASVSSGEPFIGLKLGKRTYFENSFAKSNSKTSSFSDIPISTGKKVKPSCQNTPIQRCQVEGCNLDLSSAKEYHRKHRVCETHSKCPKVVVGGLERRFCQQCSRFHSLSEFDEKKRSCRRRLSDHNARRRKPQQETIHFNSTNLSSSFYGGRQQLSFVLNNTPVVQTRPSTWENSSNSGYSIAIGKAKADKSGVLDGLPHSLAMQLPNAVNMPTIAFNRSVPSKGTRVEVLDQGFKESLPPNVDALDLRRALSLLSNNSWGVYEPDLITLDHSTHQMHPDNHPTTMLQSVPLPSSDYWQADQQPIDPHPHPHPHAKTSSNPANTQFQEFQLFNRFYSNPMDEI